MKVDRTSSDFANWANSNSSSRTPGNNTPRNKQKVNPIEPNRKSISPLRSNNDKFLASPLKVPLQQAISRCVKEKSLDKNSSRRTLGKSSRKE